MTTKLTELESQGFEGIDASLETSLFEYGIAWKEKENGEFHFYYGAGIHEVDGTEYEFNLFDWSDMSREDFIDMLDSEWFELDKVLSSNGMTRDEMIDSFPYSVFDCIQYYGIENVMGSSYYPFKIVNDYND